jgi:hypothetical protein
MGAVAAKGSSFVKNVRGHTARWSGLTLLLFGVVGLLVLSPIAQGASAGPSTVIIKAPYVGVLTYPSTSTSSSGCGAGKVVRAPFFTPSTGKSGFSIKAHADACAGLYGDSGGSSAALTLSVPIPAHSGTNVIHAKWTIQASVGARISVASCQLYNTTYSSCSVGAYSSLSAYAYLIDVTNDSYWFPTTTWAGVYASTSLYDACYGGNCSFSMTGNQHFSVNSAFVWTFHANGLNPSHVYQLQISWYSDASAYDYVYDGALSGASESASVNMAGPSFGAVLNWVSIT